MLFKYKGYNLSGDLIDGYIEADNKKTALYSLKREKGIVALVYIKRKIDNPVLNKSRENIETSRKKFIEKYHKKKQDKKIKELQKREKIKSGEVESFSIKKMLSKIPKLSLSKGGQSVNYINIPPEYVSQFLSENNNTINATYNEEEGNPVIITRTTGRPVKKTLNDGKAIDWQSLLPEEQTIEMKKNSKIRIKEKEIVLFAKKLNMMLGSGVSLLRALSILRDTSSKKLKKVLMGVMESVQRGSSLSAAFAKYPRQFDSVFVSMISIGESSGSMVKSLEDIIYYKEKNMTIKKKLRSASIYPSVIGFVLGIMLILGSVFFIPMFEKMFEEQGASLPWLTTTVFAIADKVPFVVAASFILIIITIILRRTNRAFDIVFKKFFDLLLFRVPLIKNIVNSNYMFSFSSSLALMMENGIRIKDALMLTQRAIKNIYIKSEISSAAELMLNGFSFSEAISKQPHFDELLVSILLTGEESGKMSESLREISEYYDGEVNRQVTNLMEMVQPIFILLIAAIVVPVIIAVYLPILDISSGAMLGL